VGDAAGPGRIGGSARLQLARAHLAHDAGVDEQIGARGETGDDSPRPARAVTRPFHHFSFSVKRWVSCRLVFVIIRSTLTIDG
jgi:hypothetical protein